MKYVISISCIIAIFFCYIAARESRLGKYTGNKTFYTFTLYYPSGEEVSQTYLLPTDSKFSLDRVGNSSILGIYFKHDEPFNNDFGWVVIGIERFHLDAKQNAGRLNPSTPTNP